MTQEDHEKYQQEAAELSQKFTNKLNTLIADFQRAEKCEVRLSMGFISGTAPGAGLVSTGLKADALPEEYLYKLRQEEYERTHPKIITPNGKHVN